MDGVQDINNLSRAANHRRSLVNPYSSKPVEPIMMTQPRGMTDGLRTVVSLTQGRDGANMIVKGSPVVTVVCSTNTGCEVDRQLTAGGPQGSRLKLQVGSNGDDLQESYSPLS
jgi:hypothetical protein